MRIHEFITTTLAKPQNKKHRVPAVPLPVQLKQSDMINGLTTLLGRQSNITQPTKHDIRVAKDRVETMQKRANLEFQKLDAEQLRRDT